jgi:hypothetical protein
MHQDRLLLFFYALTRPEASEHLNASTNSIRLGLKPIARLRASDRDYFMFANGQLRREIGQGHSKEERAARREKRNADYALRREYKRGRRES